MTHVRFLSSLILRQACVWEDWQDKSTWERQAEEERGRSVTQNTEADAKRKAGNVGSYQPTTFTARREQEFACMPGANFWNNHNLPLYIWLYLMVQIHNQFVI